VQGRLISLQMGAEPVLQTTLLMEGLRPLRTVLEDDFGVPICDVYYFPSMQGNREVHKLFVCRLGPCSVL